MALDVEVDVPVRVRIRLILLAADDDGLKAETIEELPEDAPRRRIARTERDCMFVKMERDRSSLRWQRKLTIVRMQCHQLLFLCMARSASSQKIFLGRLALGS